MQAPERHLDSNYTAIFTYTIPSPGLYRSRICFPCHRQVSRVSAQNRFYTCMPLRVTTHISAREYHRELLCSPLLAQHASSVSIINCFEAPPHLDCSHDHSPLLIHEPCYGIFSQVSEYEQIDDACHRRVRLEPRSAKHAT